MIVVLGKDECSKNFNVPKLKEIKDFDPRKAAEIFYSLFPIPEDKSNYALNFGCYMSIICLDSNHAQAPQDKVP